MNDSDSKSDSIESSDEIEDDSSESSSALRSSSSWLRGSELDSPMDSSCEVMVVGFAIYSASPEETKGSVNADIFPSKLAAFVSFPRHMSSFNQTDG